LNHRRRTEKLKTLLKQRVTGTLVHLLNTEIAKSIKPLSLEMISNRLFYIIENIDDNELQPEFLHYENWFWLLSEQVKLEVKIKNYLKVSHKNNPLENNGKTPEEMVSLIPNFPENSKLIILKNTLQKMCQNEILDIRENTYALKSHKVTLSHTDHVNINWIDQFILNQRMKTPLWSELTLKAKDKNIEEKRLKQMIFYLIARKRIVHFKGEYLHALIINPIRQKLLNYLKNNNEGITVAEFRDLINANRKICLLLLNIFDSEGITTRIEDKRYITEKGKKDTI